ncbi:hypothetical protein GDO78_015610 [Eleutherodactylus coqui]|uniref:Uncharacterized protein n=1 Tax=Eleutherodactylus coqui TaxID=57060 RepID=A0A8J6EQG5_ELECQ|nr:hypothetical protein GDO78_015610 [Eleutherodactylus coqui]
MSIIRQGSWFRRKEGRELPPVPRTPPHSFPQWHSAQLECQHMVRPAEPIGVGICARFATAPQGNLYCQKASFSTTTTEDPMPQGEIPVWTAFLGYPISG